MEGLAILEYLTRFYDPEHKFSFTDPLEQIDALQWMAWQHGGGVSHSTAIKLFATKTQAGQC